MCRRKNDSNSYDLNALFTGKVFIRNRGHRTGVHRDVNSTPPEGPRTPLQQPSISHSQAKFSFRHRGHSQPLFSFRCRGPRTVLYYWVDPCSSATSCRRDRVRVMTNWRASGLSASTSSNPRYLRLRSFTARCTVAAGHGPVARRGSRGCHSSSHSTVWTSFACGFNGC